jgi:hypothetical protein
VIHLCFLAAESVMFEPAKSKCDSGWPDEKVRWMHTQVVDPLKDHGDQVNAAGYVA